MDDARRFLRYVMPGLVFGVETLLLLYIVFPVWTQYQILELANKNGLGIAIGSVLASGALGYIFATVHHWCHWHLSIDSLILDHSGLINRLLAAGLVSNDSNPKVVERKEAFEISLAYWYRPKGHGNSIDDVTYKKLDSLGDQAHALDTARVASFFAVVTTLVFCFNIGTVSLNFESIVRFVLMLLLGAVVIYLFHESYRRVGTIAQAIYDRIFSENLSKLK
ncbi:MAG: hypothetical protein ACOY9D_01980 [Pseudomonadota bacterium]